MTAIHYASFTGNLNLLKEMKSNGGNIRAKNTTGISALLFAAQGN